MKKPDPLSTNKYTLTLLLQKPCMKYNKFRNRFERQTFLCLTCPLYLGFKIRLVVKVFISISTVTSFLLDHAAV